MQAQLNSWTPRPSLGVTEFGPRRADSALVVNSDYTQINREAANVTDRWQTTSFTELTFPK